MEIITLKEALEMSKLLYSYLYEHKIEYCFSSQSKSERKSENV